MPGVRDGQFRIVNGRAIRFRETEKAPESLTPEESQLSCRALTHYRNRLLVAVLVATGLRIGEVLGLRREDMRLLSTSASLGCSVRGPHLHIRRRINANGALSKNREPRSIPATPGPCRALRRLRVRAFRCSQREDCDFVIVNVYRVFVNLYRPPHGCTVEIPQREEAVERISATERISDTVTSPQSRQSVMVFPTRWHG
jgi:integrase/recombinase XerD